MIFVFTGPESTGKTTLANHFSRTYNAPLVEEYARTFLEALDKSYTFNNVIEMAATQLKMEQEAIKQNTSMLLLDTDLITYAIWLKVKYNTTIDWIDDAISNQPNKHYFLCAIDVPWETDPLREHPNEKDREALFQLHLSLLEKHQYPYTILSGNLDNRIARCKEIIEFISNKQSTK